jgi:hypothetical protein
MGNLEDFALQVVVKRANDMLRNFFASTHIHYKRQTGLASYTYGYEIDTIFQALI